MAWFFILLIKLLFRIKNDLGDDAFAVQVQTTSGGRVRAWIQVINLHNGTYIGRFRLYDYSGDLKIFVLHKGRHLFSSPFVVKGI